MTTRAEEFLDLYKHLENAIRAQAGLGKNDSPVYWALQNRADLKSMRSDLDCCREVRNFLSHNPSVRGHAAIEPDEQLLVVLREAIRRIERPPTALEVGVRAEDVLMRTMDDLVRPTIQQMHAKRYSHVPIVSDRRVVGVFSESSLLSLHAVHDSVSIDDETTFQALGEVLGLGTSTTESFVFVRRGAPIYEVGDLFEQAEACGQRIGLVFVTESGKPTERLLGIASASDLAAEL